MDLVSMLFIILFGAGTVAIMYMREKLYMKLTTALKFLGIAVGVFLLLGVIAMNVEENSIGHLFLILLVGVPVFFVLYHGIFGKDPYDNDQNKKT